MRDIQNDSVICLKLLCIKCCIMYQRCSHELSNGTQFKTNKDFDAKFISKCRILFTVRIRKVSISCGKLCVTGSYQVIENLNEKCKYICITSSKVNTRSQKFFIFSVYFPSRSRHEWLNYTRKNFLGTSRCQGLVSGCTEALRAP